MTDQERLTRTYRNQRDQAIDLIIKKNVEIERLRTALRKIEALSPQSGGIGQIARDALRIPSMSDLELDFERNRT